MRSGDIIAEIETDKTTMEVETIEDGIMGKLLVPEGAENVQVNTAIAILIDDAGDTIPEVAAADPSASNKAVPTNQPAASAPAVSEAGTTSVKRARSAMVATWPAAVFSGKITQA